MDPHGRRERPFTDASPVPEMRSTFPAPGMPEGVRELETEAVFSEPSNFKHVRLGTLVNWSVM